MLNDIARIEIYKTRLFTLFTCLWFVGIILGEKAPAILSITMVGQLLSILLFTGPKKLWNNFTTNKAMLLFSFSFLFLLLSFFYSDNLKYLTERLQIKIPLLLYAFIWPSIGELTLKQIKAIFYLFVGVIMITSTGILVNYALNFNEINQLYLESRIMPGPINHIRFSLMVVFATYVIYYGITKQLITSINARKILIAVGIFLILFLHIYAVRSGLLALYFVMAIVLLNHLIKHRNLKKLIGAVSIIGVIISFSFLISPTMRNKITNTQQDVSVYTNDKDPNFNSIATRMVSYKTALEIAKENIFVGCGIGDLRDKNDALFKRDYPTILTPIIPHNQFIYYLAATGLIGLVIFTLSFTAPLWFNKSYRIEFIQIGYAILLLAFQFEAMLETQIGVACTIVMVFIPYLFNKQQVATEPTYS
ncbi:MAG: O-antigen ligase family protein [Bacteroidia bacterium]|nr:O-antigen ligase family protein [Bacteroidia bacterium]MBP9688443.1 O-antigen ligase family protein [Bacteroidia bacterium]